ncbi:hypothetical protein Cadr_000023190 [Camelus dromedarius]|uniref:Uncharacterized protein n=1 Tax=Camelus dromedarius TaxID=9838 RepID=A0A5N4CJ05_CAMDR|nr:hypothetical protein Cadr_000023190 [Camelus dromedarius]
MQELCYFFFKGQWTGLCLVLDGRLRHLTSPLPQPTVPHEPEGPSVPSSTSFAEHPVAVTNLFRASVVINHKMWKVITPRWYSVLQC